MRPRILFPLFAEVTTLSGIGSRLGKLVTKVAGPRVIDLLWHLPSGIVDRRFSPKIAEAPTGRVATITLRVDAHVPPDVARRPYRVRCHDDTGSLTLVFFRVNAAFLNKVLPIGATRVVSGQIECYRDQIQIAHPDYIVTVEEHASLANVEPIYALTGGLTNKSLAKALVGAISRVPRLDEWIDLAYRKARGWGEWQETLIRSHAPESEADLSATDPARRRLAFDELLAQQLALALVRDRLQHRRARPLRGDGELRKRVHTALPFQLTQSQRTALADIEDDLLLEKPMLRLLQGDVGSGKTVVGFLAALVALEAGTQAAFMAPTELLVRQHAEVLGPLAEAAGAKLAVLTGGDRGKARRVLLDRLAAGDIDIIVGTHALFQGDVEFHNLAFAVIDEQHRFGVNQRLALERKGPGLHMLVMTATPIPRTLTLAVYGHMDVSRITEKPPGRLPIATRAIPLERLNEVTEGVCRTVERGGRVYWICPQIMESEVTDLAAATDRHAALARELGIEVGLVHGQMSALRRQEAMKAFAAGALKVLVATTVIEVGVDVPEATIMVVEHAERFGLAQLHQLRGRVGRGRTPSSCIMLYASPLGIAARQRLKILRETEDGFRIAEEDVRLRGSGDVLGTRQSGMPLFRLADLTAHGDLLAAAHDDARLFLQRDPRLKSARGQALRTLLYLFQREEAIRLLRSG